MTVRKFIIFIIISLFAHSVNSFASDRENFIDIEKDFLDKNGIINDGQFFGQKSYYHIGEEDFKTVSSSNFQHKFIKSEKKLLSFKQNKKNFWVKISFFNPKSIPQKIYLFSSLNFTRELSIYQEGLIHNLKHEDYLQKRVIELYLEPSTYTTFYIKKLSYGSQRQDFSYWKNTEAISQKIIELRQSWSFVIAIFLMSLFFTLILFITYKSIFYLHYTLYLIFYAIFITIFWGVMDIPYADYLGTITGFLCLVFILLFSTNFLNLEGKIKKTLLFLLIILVLNISYIFNELLLSARIQQILAGIISFTIISSAIYMYVKEREQHVAIFIVAYGTFLVGIIVQMLMWQGIVDFTSGKLMFYAGAIENILMLAALADKVYHKEKDRIRSYDQISHSYSQLKKVFYPHQLTLIQNGYQLEETMPVGRGEACVISFDIQGSSKIKSHRLNGFLREVFSSCNELMLENYCESNNIQNIVSNGFRVKELGDGLIVSVSYPLLSPTNNPFRDAISLSEKFIEKFKYHANKFNYPEDIFCGCGIGYGPIETFYPKSVPVEYDAYGRGIILAVRYESMRKSILQSLKLSGNILIIMEVIFNSMDDRTRDQFQRFDFKEHNVYVRDDPDADCLYFKIVD